MSSESDHVVSERLTAILQTGTSKAPAGFAFRVMQRILQERIKRAEAASRRLSLLVAVGLSLLTGLMLYGFSLLGFASVDWLGSVPLLEAGWLVGGLLAYAQLDHVFAERRRVAAT